MYDPPGGIVSFVRIIQRAHPHDVADLLQQTFEAAGVDALIDDARVRAAAPQLLAACRGAVASIERDEPVDPLPLVLAITAATRLVEVTDAR